MRFSCCLSQRSDILSQAFQPVKSAVIVSSIFNRYLLAEKVCCACQIACFDLAPAPLKAGRFRRNGRLLYHSRLELSNFAFSFFKLTEAFWRAFRRLTVAAVAGLPLPGRFCERRFQRNGQALYHALCEHVKFGLLVFQGLIQNQGLFRDDSPWLCGEVFAAWRSLP